MYAVERYKDIPGTKTHKPSLNPPFSTAYCSAPRTGQSDNMLEAKHLGNLKERHRNKQINFSVHPKIQNSNARQPNLLPTLRNRREGNHNSKASLFLAGH